MALAKLQPKSLTTNRRGKPSSADIACAALSGLMLTASFPPLDLSWLAWFALIPLLIRLRGVSPRAAFKLGLITGFFHSITLLYWIVVVLSHYGNINILISIGPFALLCLYMSIYPAVFSTIILPFQNRRVAALAVPATWVSLEYLRSILFTGFPWCLMGYSQYSNLTLIQISDIFGVYGISFIIVHTNVVIQLLILSSSRTIKSLRLEISTACILLGATILYGQYQLSGNPDMEATPVYLRTAIVQPNIDQSVKWDPTYREKTMSVLKRLTLSLVCDSPELIIWPETAVPFFFQNSREYTPAVRTLSEKTGASLLFGSPAYTKTDLEVSYLNRAYLINPEGKNLQYYDKNHLVPFGEYVPLKRFLFFINRLVPSAGDFIHGKTIKPLNDKGQSLGVLICFEAIFPEIARTLAKEGANLIVNMTNDAWFGKTSAPYQHLAMTVFRAVETRISVVRAANTGISAFIDSRGRILKKGGLFTEETLTHSVRINKRHMSLYTRFGDIFALSTLVLALTILMSLLIKRKLHTKNGIFSKDEKPDDGPGLF